MLSHFIAKAYKINPKLVYFKEKMTVGILEDEPGFHSTTIMAN